MEKKLVIIFGPSAVGKMTVGQELAKVTDLKLFHNHQSIEFVLPFFDFDHPAFEKLNHLIRFSIFEEVANSELPGLIFTLLWGVGLEEEEEYIDQVSAIFEKVGATIYFVELLAAQEVRAKRNSHPHRLEHKPSKRDLKQSAEVFWHFETYRLNFEEGEFTRPNYLRIHTDQMTPEMAAKEIVDVFGWKTK